MIHPPLMHPPRIATSTSGRAPRRRHAERAAAVQLPRAALDENGNAVRSGSHREDVEGAESTRRRGRTGLGLGAGRLV